MMAQDKIVPKNKTLHADDINTSDCLSLNNKTNMTMTAIVANMQDSKLALFLALIRSASNGFNAGITLL